MAGTPTEARGVTDAPSLPFHGRDASHLIGTPTQDGTVLVGFHKGAVFLALLEETLVTVSVLADLYPATFLQTIHETSVVL